VSDRIFLRPLEAADVTDEYLTWFQNDDVTRFLSVDGKSLTREKVVDYMEEGARSGEFFMQAICLTENGKQIGNLKVGPISGQHRTSDLVCVIWDRSQWGKGLATEAIRLGNTLAFEKFGVRKLTGSIMSGNVGSIKAYTRAGWIVEATLKEQYVVDGELQDEIFVSCFPPGHPLAGG
jgi:ribosomal-protein-alanine N-acetyltransferase